MLIKKAADIRESEVTPKELYVRRREFIAAAGVTAAAVATGGLGLIGDGTEVSAQNPNAQKLANLKKSPFSTDEKLNSYKDITTYNNFYEFGLDKADPGEIRAVRSNRGRGASSSKGSAASPAPTTSKTS